MATDILKEFLVSIGFDVDENSYRRFNDFLSKTTDALADLATAGAAMATAVTAGITAISDQMGKLEFASQRTGASVRGLTDLEFAFERVGISTSDAMAAVEGVARAINLQPGTPALLRAFHIDPNEDRTKVVLDLLDYLHKNFSPAVGYRFAERLGLNYNTFMADTDKMRAAFAQRDALLKQDGRDPDKEAAKAVEFNNQLAQLKAHAVDLKFTAALADFLPTAEKIMAWLEKAVDWFEKLDGSTSGTARHILEISAALGTLLATAGGLGVLRSLLGLGGGAAEAGLAAGAAPLLAGAVVGAGISYEAVSHRDQIDAWMQKHFGFTGDVAHGSSSDSGSLEAMLRHWEGFSSKAYEDIGGKLTSGYGHLLRPGEQAPANQQQAYAQFQRDMAATVAEIHRTVKVLLSSRQAVGLEDFVYNLGSGTFEKYILPLINKGDFAGAALRMESFDKFHNRDNKLVYDQQLHNRRMAEAQMVAGGKTATLNQKTDIHITSVGDADRTAQAVKKEQDRENTAMIRNLSGIMQ